MNKTTLTALALILPLAACGGSGSDPIQEIVDALADGSIDPSVIPALADAGDGDLTIDEIEDAVEDFEDEFGDIVDSEEYTDLAALPSSGTANFAGIFGAGTSVLVTDEGETFVDSISEDEVEMVGEMTMSLVLGGDDALTGEVVNLQYVEDEEAISGTLDIAAELDREADLEEEFGIFGTLTGDLTDDTGDFSVDVTLVGDIFGENAEILAGEGGGFVEIEGEDDIPVAILFGLVNQGALDD